MQGVLTLAVAAFAGESALVQGAGRTDAGVHARGQVAHVDLARDWDTDTVRDALNAHLRPHPVAVLAAEKVANGFNARTSAVKRALPLSHRQPPRAAHPRPRPRLAVAAPLDTDAMQAAARHLLGKHDFTTFRSAECQAKSPVKTLDPLDVKRDGEEITVAPRRARFCITRCVPWSARWLVGEGKWKARRHQARARSARPRRLRPSGPAGRALSDASGLLNCRSMPTLKHASWSKGTSALA